MGHFPFWITNTLLKIRNRILNRTRGIPLENWTKWLNETHVSFVDNYIFSNDACVREYIHEDFLKKMRSNRPIYWINKLLSLEIILRYIQNKWRRFL